MTEVVVRRELDRWQWMKAVYQKMHNLIDNAETHHISPTDEEEMLLEMLYRDYERGVFPLYESVMDVKEEIVSEVGLFASNSVSETEVKTDAQPIGKEFDTTTSETKTEEENGE